MHISQEQARAWFQQARVARLATVSQNQPHLVPVVFAVDQDDRADHDRIVTPVDHKSKSTKELKRLRNIAENPNVALLVDHYDDDWSQLWWVRADGPADLAAASEHPRLVDALAAKYAQYTGQRPNGTLIIVRIQRWNGWSAGAAER